MKWFDITDSAKAQMEKLLSKNPDKYAVSLAVLGGGCAGFKYDWGFIEKKEDVKPEFLRLKELPGPNFLLIKVEPCFDHSTGRVTHTPEEITERFMEAVG